MHEWNEGDMESKHIVAARAREHAGPDLARRQAMLDDAFGAAS